MIRAKARGEAPRPAAAPPPTATPPPRPPGRRPPPSRARRSSGPRPGPASSGSATPGSRSWPAGSTPSSAPGTAAIVQAGLLVPADKLVAVALYLRDRNPIKYDYLASLQSVHYEDCIEVNYQLDSTTNPGTLIELRVRTAEAEGEGEVPSLYHGLARGRLPGARSLRHDGRPLRRPPRAEAHPDVGRLRLLPAPQGLPRALLRGADQGLRQPGRRGPRPALPRRGGQPLRHQHEGPQGLQGLGRASPAATTPRARPCCPAASRSASSTPTSSSSAWGRSTRARTASSG